MDNFGFNEMQEIQKELQEKYKDQWGGPYPEKAVRMILWAFAELGEAADIMKKNGDTAILNDKEVRNRFIEELCNVMMYFNDVMLCYSITPQELKEIYLKKHEKNMSRW